MISSWSCQEYERNDGGIEGEQLMEDCGNLLLSSQVYLCVSIVSSVPITFLVNSDVVLSSAPASVNVDIDFFFGVSSIFPSDARLPAEVDLALYRCGGSFFLSSVVPVRGREDTDGNWDSGVKVQVDWLEGALLSNPFRERRSRGRLKGFGWVGV